jgi:23S rRNA G2445 N2-methylase RlmL
MNPRTPKKLKEDYQRLRQLSCEELWENEVPLFNAADPKERMQAVSVVRAVGVVFSETGTPEQKAEACRWLRGLLSDPQEKVRRYAMVALPKLDASEEDERQLLNLVGKAESEREDKFLAQTLGRIGGKATLQLGASAESGRLKETLQKVRANVARRENAGSISMTGTLRLLNNVRVALECRNGLEPFVVEELSQATGLRGIFRVAQEGRERVELTPEKPFSLGALHALRSFSEVLFVLGQLPPLSKRNAPLDLQALAALITAPHTQAIMSSFTEGTVRYRLEFASRKADPAFVQELSERVFAQCPQLLNDPREALWEVRIRESARSIWVELLPRLRPDPRFTYRQGDVPAASHPPLAAVMARLAGVGKAGPEKIWDPFCGSGLELAECVLRGHVSDVFGSDLSRDAASVAEANVRAVASTGHAPKLHFAACDFQDAPQSIALKGLRDLTLIITNPPLGKRVPVADLQRMISTLFELAERLLRPGGRLVLVNPLELRPRGVHLKLELRHKVDLGFSHFHLEKYVKAAATSSPKSPAHSTRR